MPKTGMLFIIIGKAAFDAIGGPGTTIGGKWPYGLVSMRWRVYGMIAPGAQWKYFSMPAAISYHRKVA